MQFCITPARVCPDSFAILWPIPPQQRSAADRFILAIDRDFCHCHAYIIGKTQRLSRVIFAGRLAVRFGLSVAVSFGFLPPDADSSRVQASAQFSSLTGSAATRPDLRQIFSHLWIHSRHRVRLALHSG